MDNPFTNSFFYTLDRLQVMERNYLRLIAEQSPEYPSRIHQKTGRVIRPPHMPWMVPAWQRGLKWIQEAIADIQSKSQINAIIPDAASAAGTDEEE